MKRVEKLARAHAERLCDGRALRAAAEIDFQAGYRQALEDAANTVEHLPSVGFHAAKRIRALADQEEV